MRYMSLVLAAAGLFSLSTLTGCDDNSANSVEQHLNNALSTFSQTQQGFVPRDAGDISLAEYRVQALESIIPDLETVVEQGSESQQMLARQMLADIHAAAARAQLRQARDEDRALNLRSAGLTTYLGAYEAAHARAGRFNQDNALLLEQLNEEIREQRAEREQVQQRHKALQEQLETHRASERELKDAADEARSQARQLRDRAFMADGDEQYDLEDEAAQTALRAEQRSADAALVTTEIELTSAELQLLDRQMQLIDETVENLQSQVEQVQEQTGDLAAWRSAAESDRMEARDAVLQEVEQLMEAYRSAVRPRYEQAMEQVEQAVDQAEAALALAGSAERATAEADAFARQVDKVTIFNRAVRGIGELGRTLRSTAQRMDRVEEGAAGPIRNELSELATYQNRLIEQAIPTINAARDRADTLAERNDPVGQFATDQQAQLAEKLQQLYDASLN